MEAKSKLQRAEEVYDIFVKDHELDRTWKVYEVAVRPSQLNQVMERALDGGYVAARAHSRDIADPEMGDHPDEFVRMVYGDKLAGDSISAGSAVLTEELAGLKTQNRYLHDLLSSLIPIIDAVRSHGEEAENAIRYIYHQTYPPKPESGEGGFEAAMALARQRDELVRDMKKLVWLIQEFVRIRHCLDESLSDNGLEAMEGALNRLVEFMSLCQERYGWALRKNEDALVVNEYHRQLPEFRAVLRKRGGVGDKQ